MMKRCSRDAASCMQSATAGRLLRAQTPSCNIKELNEEAAAYNTYKHTQEDAVLTYSHFLEIEPKIKGANIQ